MSLRYPLGLALAGSLLALALGAPSRLAGQSADPAPDAPEAAAPDAPDVAAPAAPDAPDGADPAPEPREPDGPPVEAPRVIASSPAPWPDGEPRSAERRPVVLSVTLDAAGSVVEAAVVESGGEPFDAAAVAAVRRWSFAPARRGGEAIAARVRVEVPFERPEPASPPLPAPSAPSASEPGPPEPSTAEPSTAEPDAFGATGDVEVEALRRQERAASDFEVDRDVLAAAPTIEGADLLRRAPGFYVARPAGGAIGHRILVRGFDAAHGQDLAIQVGGLPINLPSHVHGQGYADLGFLIAETVSTLRVREGVHDPRQGDFAVAGSVDFDLAVAKRGLRLRSSYGSFQSFRQLALWAPEGASEETLSAVQIHRTRGFGDNRRSLGASAIVQVAGERGSGGWRFRGIGFVNAARADLAGVLRADDIEAGRVGLYDVYPFATAEQQNAANARLMAGVFGERRFASGANAEVGLYAGLDMFRTQQNFTGFLQQSRTLPGVAGRGDLIEQRNRTTTVGLRTSYRSPSAELGPVAARLELGTDARLDWIGQEQNLLDATVRNQTWDERIDADVFAADIGLYADAEIELGERVTFHAGARADLLLYEVDDRLGNFAPASRPDDSFIPGFRRSALGVAAGPRTSLTVVATRWLSLMAAYGEGFRSPQARLLEDGEQAPFTKVRSADLGARAAFGDWLHITVGGYWTRLSDDVAFEPEEGALRRIAATRRLGAVLHAESRPLPWLVAAGSITYVDAELLERPPGSVEDPNPPFEAGQNLPYVPPVVVRLDVGADGELTTLGAHALTGRVGAGFSYLSPRPLPYGFQADAVALLDASAAIGWGVVTLGVEVFNLLGAEYAAFEYFFTSDWSPDGVRRRVPANHVAAGSPRTVMATLELSW